MFPEELTTFPHWVIWRNVTLPTGKVTKVPYNARNNDNALSNNPKTWTTYLVAREAADRLHSGIGFVLNEKNPYSVIDMDNPLIIRDGKYIPPDKAQVILARQKKIEETFNSYSEFSPRNGMHVWLNGKCNGTNRKRDNVEIYSHGQFMTVTGLTYRDAPIVQANGLLTILWDELGQDKPPIEETVVDQEQKFT